MPVGSIFKQQKNKLNWVPSLVFAVSFPWRDSSDVKTEFRDRNLITSGETERERERETILFRVLPNFSAALNKDYVNKVRKQIQHHTTLARPLQHSRHPVVWPNCNYISIVNRDWQLVKHCQVNNILPKKPPLLIDRHFERNYQQRSFCQIGFALSAQVESLPRNSKC